MAATIGPGCQALVLSFGMLSDASIMVAFQNVPAIAGTTAPTLQANLVKRRLELTFVLPAAKETKSTTFKLEIELRQIAFLNEQAKDTGIDIIIQLKTPPTILTDHVKKNGTYSKLRCTNVAAREPLLHDAIQLTNGSAFEMGRWLSYYLKFSNAQSQREWRKICQAFNTIPRKAMPIQIVQGEYKGLDITLSDEVLYQLEVCISHRVLLEISLTQDFARRLADLDKTTGVHGAAVQLLEHIAAAKKWVPNPLDIFKLCTHVNSFRRQLPVYCVLVQSCTVTPTTIYVHTPSVEVSNRVLRKYSRYASHFLRVKFKDEEHLGRLHKSDFWEDQPLFDRIKQAMLNGITIGQRTFKFLAYGNSQLRESGAYFFCPVVGAERLTEENIRNRLGTFSGIQVVAKYASRIGQAFSTTRTSWFGIKQMHIEDIKKGQYCFTDGVGKISQLLAITIAHDLGLSTMPERRPSAFQFRLGGCKGIVVVDSRLNDMAIYIRPSQRKFPADHAGLEICRPAQYSASFLNQQIILILDALGTANSALMALQRRMVADLEAGMTDEQIASQVLLKSVDQNSITSQLAQMISDGFMSVQEPFFMNQLALWRSWSVKSLKEKARILVPEGAYLLGGVDETATLRGHVEKDDKANLPEIFVQISHTDPRNPKRHITKVIIGLCIVGRNPSLHPGDIRVVRAVDVPALHHIRNVVIFPQTGDRDIPSMCSGGDLDGDDYFVFWDQNILPQEYNLQPMDYTAPTAEVHDGKIIAKDIAYFFVKYMQNDNLGRIATAHRYLADYKDAGVKHADCIELARLHSLAVDFAKTGVSAGFPARLKADKFPIWAGRKDVAPHKIYESNKILHRLYRTVQYVPFEPTKHGFDRRLLDACSPDVHLLTIARDIKDKYDMAVRNLMAKHEIKTEYEVYTAFVLEHNKDVGDWKLGEELGHSMAAIKHNHRRMLLDAIDVTEQLQTLDKIAPLAVAAYTVTANEYDGNKAALISFPWIFQRELGHIANGMVNFAKLTENKRPVLELKTDIDPVASEKSASAESMTEGTTVASSLSSEPTLSARDIREGFADEASTGAKSVWLDDDSEDDQTLTRLAELADH